MIKMWYNLCGYGCNFNELVFKIVLLKLLP